MLTPTQERINELTTQITFEISEMYPKITNKRERDKEIINNLAKQLAVALAKIEILTNIT